MARRLLSILTCLLLFSFPHTGKSEGLDPFPITVHIETPSQCAWGELNAISLDAREHAQKNSPVDFLVELFFLDGSWREAKKAGMAENLENPGKAPPALSFLAPSQKSAQLLGVHFCKDSHQRKTCAGIPYKNLERILDRHRVQFDGDKKFVSLAKAQIESSPSEDSVYYFQMATLLPDGLKIEQEAFGEFYAKRFFQRQAAARLTEADKARFTQQLAITASANLRGTRQSLILELPVSDQSKCQGGSQFE